MTAYAAVISLKGTIDHILHSSHFSLDDPSIKILDEASMELQPLQEILEELDDTSKSRSRKKVNALDGQIKEIIWKFEDLLESLIYDQISSDTDQNHEISFSLNLQRLKEDVDSFIQTLKDMAKEYNYALQSMPEDTDDDESLTIGFRKIMKQSNKIRLSDQLKQVKNQLMEGYHTKFVCALVGTPGVGKTTLANEIYQDPEIAAHFMFRAWIKVGRRAQHNQFSRGVLAKLYGITRERLEGKKCLIVVDDVWETRVLNSLICCLPDINGGKIQILLTARDRNVTACLGPDTWGWDHVVVRFLNEKESKDLLCDKVFGEEICPSYLDKAATKIAKNCEGLPLLIVAVADLLCKACNRDLEFWEDVAEMRNSVFTDAYSETSKVLFPTYDYLRQHLKILFLYLGAFPPDYEIFPSKIMNMLTAEGWLHDIKNEQSLENYFIVSLGVLCLSHNIVLFKEKRSHWHHSLSWLIIKTCRLHSSWRHLCIGEARKNKFYHILNRLGDAAQEVIQGQRCLCLQNNLLFGFRDFSNSVRYNCASSTRSLLFLGPYHQYPTSIDVNLKLLRELDALKLRFYTFPTQILKLVQLKYLALTCNGDVPTTISKLFNLRVLIIHPHTNIKRVGAPSFLPIQVWDMQELEHIEILGKSFPLPPPDHHVASLKKLSTIVGVHADIATIPQLLERIPSISKLGVQIELVPYSDEDTDLLSCFRRISTLANLKTLKCSIINPVIKQGYAVSASLSPLMLPQRLQKLHLSGTNLSWEHMDVIGCLPMLDVLKLRCYGFRGRTWRTREGRFLYLRFLLVEDSDLVEWKPRAGSFSQLTYLSMKHCYKLQELRWPSLREEGKIELVDCNPLALSCAKKLRPKGDKTRLYVTSTSTFDAQPVTIEVERQGR